MPYSPFSIALQSLELIRARNRKVLQVSGRVQPLQLHQRVLNVAWKPLVLLVTPDPVGLLAPKGLERVPIP
jgi:hypothetical protein